MSQLTQISAKMELPHETLHPLHCNQAQKPWFSPHRAETLSDAQKMTQRSERRTHTHSLHKES
jgi:hypothetical protein